LLSDPKTFENLTLEFPVPFISKEFSPFREYYHCFPETFIRYLNQEKFKKPEAFNDFEQIVKFTFARYGIDYANPTFNLKDVRERLYYYFKNKRKTFVETQRLKELFESDTVFRDYIQSRADFSEKLFSKEQTSGK